MDTIHESLPNTYAAKNHTHSAYAAKNHTHNEYATTEALNELSTSIGSTSISAGANLNNFTDEGVYYRDYYGDSATAISNVPSSIGTATFALEVFKGGADGQIIQRITKCDKTNIVVFQRAYYQNTWGSWKKIVDNQKILWSGAYHMNASQSVTLSENISDQVNGIVFVFSTYNSSTSTADNGSFSTFFVPKKFVEMHHGCGLTFQLNSQNNDYIGYKYIYISDGTVSGYSSNSITATKNGITYSNGNFVLRYIIGC